MGLRLAADAHEQPAASAACARWPVARSRSVISRSDWSPCSAVTSVRASTSMFGAGRDAMDQVVRQGALQRFAANHDLTRLRVRREVHRGLAGRVAAADDEHMLAGASAALRSRRRRSRGPRP